MPGMCGTAGAMETAVAAVSLAGPVSWNVLETAQAKWQQLGELRANMSLHMLQVEVDGC